MHASSLCESLSFAEIELFADLDSNYLLIQIECFRTTILCTVS